MSINVPRTFLECVQRTRQECQIPGSGPVSVLGQSGTMARLVGWVSTAWIDLQSFHDNWRFMREEVTWTMDTGEREKTAVDIVGRDRLREWIRGNFRSYDPAEGFGTERELGDVTYDAWRVEYDFGTRRDTQGQPTTVSIKPDNTVLIYPTPDKPYTIIGEYHMAAQELLANDDEPNIPVEFRMLLVYKAMTEYARYEAANEVYQHGWFQYNRLMTQLEASQLPTPQLVGASGLG